MKKNNFILLFSVILLLLFTINVMAIEVGVYVQPRDKDPYTTCVNVAAGDNAYKALSKVSDFKFQTIENSHVICQSGSDKNFVCDAANKDMLRVILQNNGDWQDDSVPSLDAGSTCYNPDTFNPMAEFRYYSFTSHQFLNIHYCAKQGDVLGVFTEDVPTSQPPPPEAQYTPSFNEVCEPLTFKNMKLYINSGNAQNLDESHDTIDDIAPGTLLEFKFSLNNDGIKNLQGDIVDISVTGTLEEIINGNDMEDGTDNFDLSPGDKKNVVLQYRIPESTQDDSYTLYIRAEGDDEYGHLYQIESKYRINIVKETEGITIVTSDASNKMLCKGEQNIIPLKIKNTGPTDENVVINFAIDSLGISSTDSVNVQRGTLLNPSIMNKNIVVTLPSDAIGPLELKVSAQYGSSQTKEYLVSMDVSLCESGLNTASTAGEILATGTSQITNPVGTIGAPNSRGITANAIYISGNSGSSGNNSDIITIAIIALVSLIVLVLIIILLMVVKNKSARKNKK